MVSSRAFAVPLLFAMLIPAMPLLQLSGGNPSLVYEPQATAVPGVVIPPIVPLPDGNGILFPVPEIPPLKPIPDLFICKDSDGGKNYFQFGVANGRDPANRAYAGTTDFNDFCADANTLNEYFCVADWVHSEKAKCDLGCESGACRKPGPVVNYCCAVGQDCIIAGVCGANGTIKCTMRAGQNMLIRNFNSACNIALDAENGGAMGQLRLENNRVPTGESFLVRCGDVKTEDPWGGLSIFETENAVVSIGGIDMGQNGGRGIYLIKAIGNDITAGNILTHADYADGVETGWSSGNTVVVGDIQTQGYFAQGLSIGSDGNNVVRAGNIITAGDDSSGLSISSVNNTVSAGNIVSSGKDSEGIYIFDSGHIVTAGNITTAGKGSEGIYIFGAMNTVTVADIVTSGDEAEGTYLYTPAYSTYSPLVNVVKISNITTSGFKSMGIRTSNASGNSMQTGAINTTGVAAVGVFIVDSSDNGVTVQKIGTKGYNSDGAYVGSFSDKPTKNNVFTLGDISTEGELSNAIYVEHSTYSAITAGNLNLAGAYSSGVYFSDSNYNSIVAGAVSVGSKSAYGLTADGGSIDSLVCASKLIGGQGKCVIRSGTLTGCENGTPIPNCANSDRNCSECGSGASCASKQTK